MQLYIYCTSFTLLGTITEPILLECNTEGQFLSNNSALIKATSLGQCKRDEGFC